MNNPHEFVKAIGTISLIFVACAFPLDPPTPTPPPVPRLPPDEPALVVLWTREVPVIMAAPLPPQPPRVSTQNMGAFYIGTNTTYTIGFYDTNGTPVVLHTFTP